MKLYLAKLGSRKFQAYLAVTIPNLIILFGFIFGNVDLEGRVNEWMPAINLGIQTIATFIYSQANVSAIKAREVAPSDQLNIPIEPTE